MMGASHERQPSPSSQPEPAKLVCPEDVDWIFDVDTLRTAGGEGLIRMNGLEEPPRDSPHYPFNMSSSSASIWDQSVRRLSMASGETHLIIAAHSQQEANEVVFYVRVAGFREEGMPRIAATFQRIDASSYQSVAGNTRQNWLYLLHEIKNPLSLLKGAEDIAAREPDKVEAQREAAKTRHFAVSCLEDHLRNGVFLATEDSKMLPNRADPLDLQLFFEELRDAFEIMLRLQNNHMELDLDIEAYRVARVDRTLLSQLLNNLLINKINLLKDQTLKVECKLGSTRTDGTGALLIITIEDEGPPFPDFILQDIEQEPDVEGLLRIHKNSGLGLPICRRITSVMGGELKFFNDPPKTRIRIWIPLS